ncbi:MAG TPA: SGNH/GDSL hydrolase family protein [Microthrixaceae bacterium]|nr:SGNH/GDSL hydrolase family protein [Microthrixaceae bacterium]
MKFKSLLLVAALLSLILVACQTQPNATGPHYNVTPPACPYNDTVIQHHGDSVGALLPRFMNIPGYQVFNAAEGGSAFTIRSYVPTIGERVHEWIGQCGKPRLAIIQGGINDLASSVDPAVLLAAVKDVSDYLASEGIPAVFVELQPFADNRAGGKPVGYQWIQPNRIAYNAALASPDSGLIGDVINCNSVLEDPANPGWLDPKFYKFEGVMFDPSKGMVPAVNGTHLSETGYQTYASCISGKVTDLLG